MEPITQSRAGAAHWFERVAGPACSAEAMFFALLVLQLAPLKAVELHAWAAEAFSTPTRSSKGAGVGVEAAGRAEAQPKRRMRYDEGARQRVQGGG